MTVNPERMKAKKMDTNLMKNHHHRVDEDYEKLRRKITNFNMKV